MPGLFPLDSNRNNTLEQNLSATREFEGEADSSQSNSLSGAITVTIADVLPNGNLMVRGEKWLTLNQGEEFIQISGMVRPQDVSTSNTVLSTQIADARITYSGEGFLAESNQMGWLARFFNHPIWPF
jgi:flagellar L-ring protein precursor FlgH